MEIAPSHSVSFCRSDRKAHRKDVYARVGINHTCSSSARTLAMLLDGRAYTLREVADAVKADRTSTLSWLNEMVKAGVLKIRISRMREYYHMDSDLIDDMAVHLGFPRGTRDNSVLTGMKYCRHCYHHLAGYVGVELTEVLVKEQLLTEVDAEYAITLKGWQWFSVLGLSESDLNERKPMAVQCLDFSERRSHLGGQLGDALLGTMLARGWVVKVPDSREMTVTAKGRGQLKKELNLDLGTDRKGSAQN